MKENRLIYLFILVLMGLAANLEAATITLDPSSGNQPLDGTFTVDLVGVGFAAADATQGGGVDLDFDASVLNVNSVSFGSSAFTLSTAVGNIDNVAGKIESITVAELASPPSGDFNIATIEFSAVGLGSSALGLGPSTFFAPWIRASDGTDINPGLLDGSVTVTAVPAPAAVWLFLGGLALIGRIARTR